MKIFRVKIAKLVVLPALAHVAGGLNSVMNVSYEFYRKYVKVSEFDSACLQLEESFV